MNWADTFQYRVIKRAMRTGRLDAAQVAAHDETWAKALEQLRPKYDTFRSGRRKRGSWLEVLKAFIVEYWDDILRILLALLPLILEEPT